MSEKKRRIFLSKKENKEYKRIPVTAQSALTFTLMLGLLASARDMLYNDTVFWITAAVGTAMLVILQLSHKFPRFEKIAGTAIWAAEIILLFLFLADVIGGFLYTANRIILLWNEVLDADLRLFDISGDLFFDSLIFWILLSIPLTSAINTIIRRRMFSMMIFVIALGMLFGFVFGRASMSISIVCITFSITGILIYSPTPERSFGFFGFSCLAALIFLFLSAFLIFDNYSGSKTIALWKKAAAEKAEILRYGSDTLPKGKLEKASELLIGNEDVLEISAERAEKLYLTGFVGGVYEKNQWKPLKKEIYTNEYDGIIGWLNRENLSPLKQYASYSGINNSEIKYSNVKIKNKGAYRGFVYLPRSVASWSSVAAFEERDWYVVSRAPFGASEYELDYIADSPCADEIVVRPWLLHPQTDKQHKYVNAEAVYHYFVKEKYSDIDDDLKSVIDDMFFPDNISDDSDFNNITTQIRRILRIETQYTPYPKQLPNGSDFIRWFLCEEKKGNAVHYASAAVMAYRAAGYPARYAEGYCFFNTEESTDNENINITLTNKNSHAWAEVYVTGAGWMPVEVVPGMYVETYTNQLVEGKPAFQLGLKPDGDNADIALEELERAVGRTEPEKNPPRYDKLTAAVILLFLYICFFLYLILELQRFIRIYCRRLHMKHLDNETLAIAYADEIQKTLKYAGVIGNYNHPYELTREVCEKFPSIPFGRYERAIFLLQKVRFGKIELSKAEQHALHCYVMRLKRELYTGKSLLFKLKLRYKYAVEC